jgi:maltose alpha-D-glucosyltransferase/alpha-amylase
VSGLAWNEVVAAVEALDRDEISAARWYGGKGRAIERIEPVEAFDLAAGAVVIVHTREPTGRTGRYLVPFSRQGDGLGHDPAGTAALRGLAIAISEGRTLPAVPHPEPAGTRTRGPAAGISAALVCRPAGGLGALVPAGGGVRELPVRPLDADQSNTSIVLGQHLLLKAYRGLADGLNPDLEMNAYLSEEVRFPGVPRVGGYAELVSTRGTATVALLQEFVADGADAYETTAEGLTAWILAPGEVTVEFATEIAAAMGSMTADLHAALSVGPAVPGFETREATRDELREWRRAAQRQLARAIDVVTGPAGDELRAMAPVITEQLTVLEAIPSVPLVSRVHADLHLGQVLLTPDGPRIVDFEGEPTRPIEDRRRPTSPLRDAASMLRSLDHVGHSARRRAERRRVGLVARPGLDVDAWLVRARERFVEAYRRGLAEHGSPITVDADLLRAFEFEKECYEFVYAATYLPDWMWAPLQGMRSLVAEAQRA